LGKTKKQTTNGWTVVEVELQAVKLLAIPADVAGAAKSLLSEIVVVVVDALQL